MCVKGRASIMESKVEHDLHDKEVERENMWGH